jgi:PAS domain-containing protein
MLCEDRFRTVFTAAQSAIIRLGGRVTHANQASGTILGRLEADDLGYRVDLSIALSRIPENQTGTQESITIVVRATKPGVSDPEPERTADLRRLEEQYLALVGDRATCGTPF